MKLDELLNEQHSRDYDESRIADILQNVWNENYVHFSEDVSGIVDELDQRFPNNKKVTQAQSILRDFLSGYDNCKISKDDHSFLEKHENSIYYNADKLNSVEGTLKALFRYKNAVEQLDKAHVIFCNYWELEDEEYGKGTFEYGKTYDPYEEHGVSRKDF